MNKERWKKSFGHENEFGAELISGALRGYKAPVATAPASTESTSEVYRKYYTRYLGIVAPRCSFLEKSSFELPHHSTGTSICVHIDDSMSRVWDIDYVQGHVALDMIYDTQLNQIERKNALSGIAVNVAYNRTESAVPEEDDLLTGTYC